MSEYHDSNLWMIIPIIVAFVVVVYWFVAPVVVSWANSNVSENSSVTPYCFNQSVYIGTAYGDNYTMYFDWVESRIDMYDGHLMSIGIPIDDHYVQKCITQNSTSCSFINGGYPLLVNKIKNNRTSQYQKQIYENREVCT